MREECASCGTTENLSACSRCLCEVYCSKECLRLHWDEHKTLCDDRVRHRKNSKEVLSGKAPIECTMSHMGPVFSSPGGELPPVFASIGIGPQMDLHFGMVKGGEMPPGVPDGLTILRKAVHEYVSRKEDAVQYGETSYKSFYEEMLQNETEWIDFFQHPENVDHLGDACMLLAALFRILYERSDFQSCARVIDKVSELHPIWKNNLSIRGSTLGDEPMKNCYHVEECIHNRRYSINMRFGRYKENVPIVRWICEHDDGCNEFWKSIQKTWVDIGMTDLSEEVRKEFVAYLKANVMGPNWKFDHKDIKVWGQMGRRILKAKTVHDIPDDVLEEMLRVINNERPLSELDAKYERDVHLMACGNCSKKESACGEFKRCNRCKATYYCSRECQVEHWKSGHKNLCVDQKKKHNK